MQLMKSRNCSTSKQYSPHIQCSCDFLSKRSKNQNVNINDEAKYLSQHFLRALCKYSVINTTKSTLPSIFLSGKELTFGKHPIIQRFLKGCLKKANISFIYNDLWRKASFRFFKKFRLCWWKTLKDMYKTLNYFLAILRGNFSAINGGYQH